MQKVSVAMHSLVEISPFFFRATLLLAAVILMPILSWTHRFSSVIHRCFRDGSTLTVVNHAWFLFFLYLI